MMRSMFSGVSGLKVHQTKMDVIGNNISNVNTVGYKSQRVTFNEVFSQTLQGASAASDDTGRGGQNAMQIGLGANVSSIDMLMTQGAAERTDNPFDVMINGDGFLVVGDASGQYFTRAGALRTDKEGNLCISNGMKVRGWMATESANGGAPEINKGQVQDIKLSSAMSSAPKMTQNVALSGNLCSTEEASAAKPLETSISFYDSLGNYYKAVVKLTAATPATDGSVTYTATVGDITDTNGKALQGYTAAFDGATTLKFDKDGKLVTTTATGGATTGDKLTLKFTQGTGYTSNLSDITVDCSDMTRYASKNTLKSKTTDGNSAGTMSGYSLGGDGIITATYTNGDKRVVGQVVVAEFDNPAGLEKVGENLFQITSNSGDFDGVGKAGDFSTGCLEMSNVDLSSEFTQMITTQRGFQANSRIITVSDEMLQELTNLKR